MDGSGGIETFRKLAAGPVEAYPERPLGAAEHQGCLGHVQTVPSDQPQYLTLLLGKGRESGCEGIAASDRLGWVVLGRARSDLVHEAEAEIPTAAGGAVLLADHVGGDRVEPWQGALGDAVAATPGNREGVADHVFGYVVPGDAAEREGEELQVMVSEAAFEAAAVDVLSRLRRMVDWKHLGTKCEFEGGCYVETRCSTLNRNVAAGPRRPVAPTARTRSVWRPIATQ